MITIKGEYTTAKIMIDEVEPSCLEQINKMVNHPAFTNPIAIMPDCHAGKGSVIGFTMKMTDKLIPNIVGVDGYCGVSINKIVNTFKMPSLEHIDNKLRELIPVGRNVHDSKTPGLPIGYLSKVYNAISTLSYLWKVQYGFGLNPALYSSREQEFRKLCEKIGTSYNYVLNSFGTLGDGNHYIALNKDEKNRLYFEVHTGSRILGKKICEYWQQKAKEYMVILKEGSFSDKIDYIKRTHPKELWNTEIKKARETYRKLAADSNGLEYLEGMDALNYLKDMAFADIFAYYNRNIILSTYTQKVDTTSQVIAACHTIHNYVSLTDFYIRKGASESYSGSTVIIPLNMKAGTLLCKGIGNPEWNYSAPHGAGRILSRAKAREIVDIDEYKKSMEGIFSTSVSSATLDEAPSVYKDPETIKKAIKPTASIFAHLKPILNIKGKSLKDS